MKKRLIPLLLVLVLVIGVLAIPASAASAQDVFNYLVNEAKSGYHDASKGYYTSQFYIDEEEGLIYGVYFWENDNEVEVTIFNDSLEATLVLSSSMSTPYTAYIYYYDYEIYGEAGIYPSSYTENTSLSFSYYEGDSSVKSTAQDGLKELLPYVLEYPRAILYDGGYTLKAIGFNSFTRCTVHIWDDGVVTTPATCAAQGQICYTCLYCGEKEYEAIPIDSTTHVWTVQTPGAVTGDVHQYTTEYVCSRCGQTKTDRLCAGEIFTDMPADSSYSHNPIDWAYFNGITQGTSAITFGPKGTCTRAQIVTFLWRANGSPEPTETENPFEDVHPGDYYYEAVLWAVENYITLGTSETTFSPGDGCTRAQVVSFLWRAEGKSESGLEDTPFEDIHSSAYYYKAVLWAVEHGITSGTTATTFSPADTCTREQIVTFLYRALAE